MLPWAVNYRAHLPRPYRGLRRKPEPHSISASPLRSFLLDLQRSAVKSIRSNCFRINTSKNVHFSRFWHHLTPFRINTCKSVSKQTTLSPFRINTYEKTGGWGEVIPVDLEIQASCLATGGGAAWVHEHSTQQASR